VIGGSVYAQDMEENNVYADETLARETTLNNLNEKNDFKNYARKRVLDVWNSDKYVDALFWIIQKESKWNPLAQNKDSSAYGIGQFLNKTWKITGYKKTPNPYIQIDAMIVYVKKTHGNPISAKNSHRKKGWY